MLTLITLRSILRITRFSVSDLLTSLTDITSDPARLNLVKEIHNRSALAALGHTTESIKLPPEKRDRKRKVGGKVGVGSQDILNSEASGGRQDSDGSSRAAQQEGSRDEIGASSADVRGVAGGAKAAVTVPETTQCIGGPIRKGKARADVGETVSGESFDYTSLHC